MNRKFKSQDIKEPLSKLWNLYKNAHIPAVKRRIHMLILYKEIPDRTILNMAKIIGVSDGAIDYWLKLYESEGITRILIKRKYSHNGSRKISPEIHKQIEQRLKKKPFEGYAVVHKWIQGNYLPGISYNTLTHYIRRHFNNPKLPSFMDSIKIKESISQLQNCLEQCNLDLKPRINILILLKQKKFKYKSKLAKEAGVSQSAVGLWLRLYEEKGIARLMGNR